MTTMAIKTDRLTKLYGPATAVNEISFEVPRGQVLGFLGPNGAGKSTTMKMLTCYLTPTRGRAEVAGFDVYTQSLEVRRRIGYLPEDTPLYKDMTVLEYLEYVARLRRVPAGERRARLKRIGETTGILHVLGKLIGELSRGYRQRVGLTQAMLHEPEILILDEPTNGLDPNQIVEIRALIKELGKEKTVILSTHILPEVQATCDRVVIISDGRLVADGRPDDLVARELAKPRADTFLDEVWRFDVTTLIVDDPVKRVDNMPMAWGLEARVPFLDHELVELAARIPAMSGDATGTKARLEVFGKST